MTLNKAFGSEVKSADSETGVIEALVATYDQDSVGDKIYPGAFQKTIADWKDSGRSMPLIFAHQHDNPDAYLGSVTEAKETDEGLYVKAQFDMNHAPAKRVFDLMKSGSISQFSFAYNVTDGEFVSQKSDDGETTDEYYALKELKVHEVGPCLIGANQNTRLLGAKRAEFVTEKTSETDVKSAEEIQAVHDTMVQSGAKCAHSEAKTNDVKTKDRDSGKVEERNPVSVLLEIDLITLDEFDV